MFHDALSVVPVPFRALVQPLPLGHVMIVFAAIRTSPRAIWPKRWLKARSADAAGAMRAERKVAAASTRSATRIRVRTGAPARAVSSEPGRIGLYAPNRVSCREAPVAYRPASHAILGRWIKGIFTDAARLALLVRPERAAATPSASTSTTAAAAPTFTRF